MFQVCMRIPDNAHLCCILYSFEDYVNKMKCYKTNGNRCFDYYTKTFVETRQYKIYQTHFTTRSKWSVKLETIVYYNIICSYLSMIVKHICTNWHIQLKQFRMAFWGDIISAGPPLINYMGMIIQIGPSRFGRRWKRRGLLCPLLCIANCHSWMQPCTWCMCVTQLSAADDAFCSKGFLF